MRPGSLFAAGCVALLAYWKLGEGAHISAVLLFTTAAGLLVLGMLPRRSDRPRETTSASSLQRLASRASANEQETTGARRLTADELGQVARTNAREVRVWRFIGIGGLVISVAGVFYFPPMALVVAALALYAFHRMRKAAYEGRALQPGSTGRPSGGV